MESPIGIFDSGLGGLSVASRILETLPNESLIYLADNAHVPYGERPLEEVRSFAVAITGFLIERGAKVVVMACNMSSAIALNAAREHYKDVPIIGVIEPGASAAVRIANKTSIGVLATTGTVNSGAYISAINSLCTETTVFQKACPKFVPIIESGNADTEEAEAAACTYTSSLIKSGCKTLILGCTHYPFVRRAIESSIGKDIKIVDPAIETTNVLKALLISLNKLNTKTENTNHVFCATGETKSFETLGSSFIGRRINKVEHIEWGKHIHSLPCTTAAGR